MAEEVAKVKRKKSKDKELKNKRQKVASEHAAEAAATNEEPATNGRPYTVSIAVPGSVIENTQSLELAMAVAGQIARTAAIFNVDEVVVVDDCDPPPGPGEVGAGSALLARVLQFMETPQYLRKALIQMHPDLRLAGLLPPLDAPHHMRATEWGPYREGVVLASDPAAGSLIDVGLDKPAHIPQAVRLSTRVTLAMGEQPTEAALPASLGSEQKGAKVLQGRLAAPSEPRELAGLYWGYSTRVAAGLAAVFEECPFEGGYDLKVGTSEHGSYAPAAQLGWPPFWHLLVAFGGPKGLEHAASVDRTAQPLGVEADAAAKAAKGYFDAYLNVCPKQGSRTIRTEEAILISMAFCQPAIEAAIGSG